MSKPKDFRLSDLSQAIKVFQSLGFNVQLAIAPIEMTELAPSDKPAGFVRPPKKRTAAKESNNVR